MTTVLIIDDEYLIADILSFALEDEGFLTVTAGSALRALDILDRERPDLIITDFMMPGMTGIEFAEAVRAREVNNAIPIMLMSGAQAYLGIMRPDLFADVFQKPFDIETVVSKVRSLVNLDT
ncbi:response regulator [Pseudomonas syringae]|uniref:Histidine kinase n=1 Tax=Pseudomonas syringae TaxID=317 RepID=A0A085V9L7_PSESX|nr:response regulator [Pseudomonas syringae]KFE52130.1 histidine kinase [Pseudomonas syringae]